MKHSLLELAALLGGEVVNIDQEAAASCFVHNCRSMSTAVHSGDLFVAVRGTKSDGHAFVDDARARGASAAVVEVQDALGRLPGIVVQHTPTALSSLGAHFAGYPSQQMVVVGITGTNGKTTTTSLVAGLLDESHLDKDGPALKAFSLGTLGLRHQGLEVVATKHTTPDALEVNQLLRVARDQGAAAVAMEVSSHALDQCRVDAIEFDCGVFTNLTRDHLDYHGTFAAYLAAKLRLFELVGRSPKQRRGVVVNLNDPHGADFCDVARAYGLPVLTYGDVPEADLRLTAVRPRFGEGSEVSFEWEGRAFAVTSPLLGDYNASNLVAAIGVTILLGRDLQATLAAVPSLSQVPGRLQRIHRGEVTVLIDYAHTPDALERVLSVVRQVCRGRLWVVFGCGGDRDRGKRPQMGEIASRLADVVVVTSDNPRSETPEKIIHDILGGAKEGAMAIIDRGEAIRFAAEKADPGDVVVVAGKGHEDYQILGDVTIPFSDVEHVTRALAHRFG